MYVHTHVYMSHLLQPRSGHVPGQNLQTFLNTDLFVRVFVQKLKNFTENCIEGVRLRLSQFDPFRVMPSEDLPEILQREHLVLDAVFAPVMFVCVASRHYLCMSVSVYAHVYMCVCMCVCVCCVSSYRSRIFQKSCNVSTWSWMPSVLLYVYDMYVCIYFYVLHAVFAPVCVCV
jgi:hypothetical protein